MNQMPTWPQAKEQAQQVAAENGHGLVGFHEGTDGFIHARCEFCTATVRYNRFEVTGDVVAAKCAIGDGPPALKRMLRF